MPYNLPLVSTILIEIWRRIDNDNEISLSQTINERHVESIGVLEYWICERVFRRIIRGILLSISVGWGLLRWRMVSSFNLIMSMGRSNRVAMAGLFRV